MGCIDLRAVPRYARVFWYTLRPPLVKRSKLAPASLGGVGKELSTGWAINYVVGCLHGCPFCYAAAIAARNPRPELRRLTAYPWGSFIALPVNFSEALAKTPWSRWSGEEVLLSSMHDPYLAVIARCTRRILEQALPRGVRFRIQTRSTLVLNDLGLLARYRDRVRLQVSVATMDERFSRIIEPYAPPPRTRILVLKKAREKGIPTGAIVSPIFPPTPQRKDVLKDLLEIARQLAEAGVEIVYGESLHRRGSNLAILSRRLNYALSIEGWDQVAEKLFYKAMDEYGLKAIYWREPTP